MAGRARPAHPKGRQIAPAGRMPSMLCWIYLDLRMSPLPKNSRESDTKTNKHVSRAVKIKIKKKINQKPYGVVSRTVIT